MQQPYAGRLLWCWLVLQTTQIDYSTDADEDAMLLCHVKYGMYKIQKITRVFGFFFVLS